MKKLIIAFVFFFIVTNISAQTYSVTFQVDMNVQKNYGVFDPNLSDVKLRGTFNDWTDQEGMIDSDNDGIYTLTRDIPAGENKYKFFFINTQGQSVWEEMDDRVINISSDSTLAVVYFLNDAGTKTLIDVYFSVNMEIEAGAGRFDFANDNVTVRGNFNGWGDSDTCYSEILNPFVYSKVVKYLAEVGDVIHYKFNINGEGWEVDFPDNDGGHRLIEITQEDINNLFAVDPFTYPNQFFNGLDVSQLTQQSTEITFTVDMNGATDLNGAAFSELENVFICGSASPLFWAWESENQDKAIFLVDDGTNGDATSGDNIWSTIVSFPRYTTINAFNYKFGANYDLPSNNGLNDNENYPGEDHWIQFTSDLLSGTVHNIFGNATTPDNPHTIENIVTDVNEEMGTPNKYELQQNYPNPFNPSTIISYSLATDNFITIKIYDVLGNQIKTLVEDNISAGTHKVAFNGAGLPSGIYFARLESKDFSSSIKMILIK